MIIYITGRPQTGKTTLGRLICEKYEKTILLDGDDLREALDYHGFSKGERSAWMLMIARLALLVEAQGYIPIIALVSPIKDVRKRVFKMFKTVLLVYLPGGEKHMWEGSIYEEPDFTEAEYFIKRDYEID